MEEHADHYHMHYNVDEGRKSAGQKLLEERRSEHHFQYY
jgi:hypothetical protein